MQTDKPAAISLDTCPEDKEVGLSSCLFNIVVFSPLPQRTKYFKGLVHSIVEHFPSRIHFAEMDCRSTAPKVTVEFQSSAIRRGPYLTGYEEAIFHFTPEQRAQIPFLILPYLLPDLPVVLLWGQDPSTELEILPQLLKHSTRLIFDSETADNLQRFSARILAQAEASLVNLVDLNWARMKGWRDAFDEVFDTHGRLKQLRIAKKISITFNSREDDFFHKGAIQALYLQAWLASRLGWKLKHLEPGEPITRVTYSNGEDDTEIELCSEKYQESPPGSILSVEIEGGYEHHFSLKQKPGTEQATVHIASTEACELPFSVMISGPRLKYQFLKDLFYGGSSEHYLQTLQMLSQQDWKQ